MKQIYVGKTKDVYETMTGDIVLKFKDDVTGTEGTFDPGADTVGLTMDGAGQAALKLSTFFFEKLNEQGYSTHFISANIAEKTMTVKKVEMLGDGLEFICRFKAIGSFYARYKSLCEKEQDLDALVEITIKDDDKGDPLITADTLIALDIVTEDEYLSLKKQTQAISLYIKETFQKKGLELYDLKLEFGRDQETSELLLIDEISGGNMRVFKNNESISPITLAEIICTEE